MNPNHQLARRSNIADPATILQAFEQASQLPGWTGILHAIAQDKRQDLAPHVVTLWTVKLAKYPEEDIAQVLTAGAWKFFPSIDEVIADLDAVADARRLERQADRDRTERKEAERARESWQDPKQQAELKLIIADLGRRLTLVRMNDLGRPDPARSPRNVIALSQAKVLRLPPKKSPKTLPAEAGEAPKRIEKVARRK